MEIKSSGIADIRSYPILSYEESRTLDSITQKEWGICGITLMGLAAKSFFDAYRDYLNPNRKICILAGKGNNGGDGYALGYFLLTEKIPVTIYETISNEHTPQASFYRSLFLKAIEGYQSTGHIYSIQDFQIQSAKNFDTILDCLLGTGSRGELSKELQSIQKVLIDVSISHRLSYIALDHASFGDTLKYDSLGEIGTYKLENLGFPNRDKRLITIGFPIHQYLKETPNPVFLYPKPFNPVKYFKKKASHKYDAGSCVFLGGDKGMEGAIRLSSSAFMGLGGGICKVFFYSAEGSNTLKIEDPSYMTAIWEDNSTTDLFFTKSNCLVWGPGTHNHGNNNSTAAFIREWLDCSESRFSIWDAGAIPSYGSWNERFFHKQLILTPHLGEFKRLVGASSSWEPVQCLELGKKFCLESSTNLFIKSDPCIFINHEGTAWIWDHPNPKLATMGTGDILTGILAYLFTQGYSMEVSVYLAMNLLLLVKDHPSLSPNAWEILNFLKTLSPNIIPE